MKVLLIDVDSRIPNLALMQISAWHKAQGDTVSLDVPNNPDKVYISCIFKKNRTTALGIAKVYPNAEVLIGGSGVNYQDLPEEMDTLYPDYDLYKNLICQRCGHQSHACKCTKGLVPGNMFYSMGFTTRGCIRQCPFCIVRDKEGPFHRWQHVSEFVNPKYKKVILLDNNVYADKKWFFENTDYILEKKLAWNPIQGMDIRLLDHEIAQRLKELKWWGRMKFAWDNMADENAVRDGIFELKEVGIDIRNRVQFYVLVNFCTTQEQDKYRCRELKKLGTNAFVMAFKKDDWSRHIGKWANRKWIYWSCDIDDYETPTGKKLKKKKIDNAEYSKYF